MRTRASGWDGEEYKITIMIARGLGQTPFTLKQLRLVIRRARQACPKLRPKPDTVRVSRSSYTCMVELTYLKSVIVRGFQTTADDKIEPKILAALREKLPDL